jgi:predicted metal-binding membrane protein
MAQEESPWLQKAFLLTMILTSNSTRLTAALLIVAGAVSNGRLGNRPASAAAQDRGDSSRRLMERRPLRGAQNGRASRPLCLGCCWAVIEPLFAAGVINLLWAAAWP